MQVGQRSRWASRREVAARRRVWSQLSALALALSVSLAGCTLTRPLPRSQAPLQLPEAAELESLLNERQASLHSLRALARLRYRDGEESGSSRQVVIVSRPNRLRVEVLSILGTVFVVTADDQTFSAYARDEATVYRGTPSQGLMARYARVALTPSELVSLVLASPELGAAGDTEVEFDDEIGALRLRRKHRLGDNTVWFSSTRLPLAAEQRDGDGDVEWRAEFGAYEEQGGFMLATQVNLEFPRRQRRIELSLQDAELNPSLDNSLFALPAPAGAKVVDLDQGAE